MNSYFLVLNGQQAGPFSIEQLTQMYREGRINGGVLAFTQGMTQWTPIKDIAALAGLSAPLPPSGSVPPPVSAAGAAPASMVSAVGTQVEPGMVTTQYGIHYQVVGAEMQFVEILLDPMQTIVAEA